MLGDTSLGTILVVDDERQVRQIIANVLVRAGYRVIQAAGAAEAKLAISVGGDEIALMVCDIRMPGDSGLDLANDLAIIKPGLKILYVSGMVDSVAVAGIRRHDPSLVLTKPFTPSVLVDRVGEMLASPGHFRVA
jgi:two-component system cell cycle sensor histidine kinase/response regulator CckA